jgi:beta-N-acetylhexosaminidase
MTTHTIYTDIDPDHPATLSDVVIPRLLRGELGYDSVVTTDCMEMKAIDDNYGVVNSVTRAANAGVDIILFSHTPEKQKTAYDALLQAVQVAAVSLETVHAANARIAALKTRFPAQTPDPAKVYTAANQETVKQLARDTITLVRSDVGALPLNGPVRLVEFTPSVDSEVQESADDSTLAHALKAAYPDLTVHLLPAVPSETNIAALPEEIEGTLVVATRNAHRITAQAEAVAQLAERGKRVILVALRNPYDAHLLDGGTMLVSGGDSRPSLAALADALTGAFTPQGRIEVGE